MNQIILDCLAAHQKPMTTKDILYWINHLDNDVFLKSQIDRSTINRKLINHHLYIDLKKDGKIAESFIANQPAPVWYLVERLKRENEKHNGFFTCKKCNKTYCNTYTTSVKDLCYLCKLYISINK